MYFTAVEELAPRTLEGLSAFCVIHTFSDEDLGQPEQANKACSEKEKDHGQLGIESILLCRHTTTQSIQIGTPKRQCPAAALLVSSKPVFS